MDNAIPREINEKYPDDWLLFEVLGSGGENCP